MEEQPKELTKHEKKELKKQLKLEKQQKKEERVKNKSKKKTILTWSIVLVSVVGVIFLIVFLMNGENGTYSKGQVHWHAELKVFLCSTYVEMPAPFGEEHLGQPLLHTHSDRLIHIEGTVRKAEDITLGKYMELIGKNFQDDSLLENKNGDLCNTTEGRVKLYVNNVKNSLLTRYVIKDGDKYELRFE